jgi:hypothetical protein
VQCPLAAGRRDLIPARGHQAPPDAAKSPRALIGLALGDVDPNFRDLLVGKSVLQAHSYI